MWLTVPQFARHLIYTNEITIDKTKHKQMVRMWMHGMTAVRMLRALSMPIVSIEKLFIHMDLCCRSETGGI